MKIRVVANKGRSKEEEKISVVALRCEEGWHGTVGYGVKNTSGVTSLDVPSC